MQTQGLIIHNIMQRISSIIVLLHIFKQSATEDTSLSLQKFENNAWIRAWKLGIFWTWHENPLSAADIGFSCQLHMLLYCMLTVCSWPIRFFIVSVMYNNNCNVFGWATSRSSAWQYCTSIYFFHAIELRTSFCGIEYPSSMKVVL